jgi:hypothetical protein
MATSWGGITSCHKAGSCSTRRSTRVEAGPGGVDTGTRPIASDHACIRRIELKGEPPLADLCETLGRTWWAVECGGEETRGERRLQVLGCHHRV